MNTTRTRTKVIAYNLDDLCRLTDQELQSALSARRHYPLISLMPKDDIRRTFYSDKLSVPSIKVTESLIERVQQAFTSRGIPVLFTWVSP